MAEGQPISLESARRAFLWNLLRRRLHLRLSAGPPASYYVGQEYVEDRRRIPCTITLAFLCPGVLKPTVFWHRGSRVSLCHKAPFLVVEITRKVPTLLWDDIRVGNWRDRFIVGYVTALMPVINKYLLEVRYLDGHPLSRTYSALEAANITVAHDGAHVCLGWPVSVPPFPRSEELAPGRDEPYLRDFVDAIHSYFRSDFDDCIRRVVTSVETFFAYRGWKAACRPSTFKRVLDNNVEKDSLGGQVVTENLKYVYKIRNRIVHGGFRMSRESGMFCDKAIATLRYLIQRCSGDATVSRYAFSHGMQFLLLQSVIGQHLDLDEIERFQRDKHAPGPPINSMAEMDTHMFTALRFTDRDKRSIR